MMQEAIPAVGGALDALREQTVHLLTDTAAGLGEVGEVAKDDRARLLDMAADLREAFFLVAIIGEFNAGKSTFINAMLGEPLLPMGVTPTTEGIELVRYSAQAVRVPTIREGTSTREWAHPNTGGQGVALVDTPGTGSVFQRHETTAKGFLHRSDLVIFVVNAKRALADAERIYLELAKQYGKKIIIAVNQVDLLDPSERDTVRRFVEQQVKQTLGISPLIFMVSAKEALSGGGDGGIGAVKAHLRGVFANMPPAQQKLLAQLNTAQHIIMLYENLLSERYDTVSADSTRAKTIRIELEQQSGTMADPLRAARNEIDGVFETLRQRGIAFIDTNLNIRILRRGPTKEKLQADFLEQVISRAPRDINEAATGYVNALVDSSRVYWRGVIERLNKLRDVLESEVGGLDATAYAQQREGLDEAIRIAETEIRSYQSGQLMNELHAVFETNMNGLRSNFLFASGGLLLVLLAIAPAGPIIGAGAAPLALPAMVFGAPLALLGGYGLIRYISRVANETKADFNARVDKLKKTYHDALDDLTNKERTRLSQYGIQVLTPIFSRLEALAATSKAQLEIFQRFSERAKTLKDTIESKTGA